MTKIEEIKTNDYQVSIEYDEYAESPRDWGSALGTMICWHRRYTLGDKHNFQEPSDFAEAVSETDNLILPLYLYDHSGITMNTTGFSCQWDSGQVGWYYVSYKDIEKEYGAVNDETIQKAKETLIAEVELYDTYLRGEVFGYRISKRIYNGETNDMEYDLLDSCWGFYGDIKNNGILDAIDEYDKSLGDAMREKLGVNVA